MAENWTTDRLVELLPCALDEYRKDEQKNRAG